MVAAAVAVTASRKAFGRRPACARRRNRAAGGITTRNPSSTHPHLRSVATAMTLPHRTRQQVAPWVTVAAASLYEVRLPSSVPLTRLSTCARNLVATVAAGAVAAGKRRIIIRRQGSWNCTVRSVKKVSRTALSASKMKIHRPIIAADVIKHFLLITLSSLTCVKITVGRAEESTVVTSGSTVVREPILVHVARKYLK